MKVTLESTSRIVNFNGVECRVWEGKTEGGIDCYAIIPRIAHHKADDAGEFLRDLKEHKTPSPTAVEVFPLRNII